MPLKIYNTLTHKLEDFVAADPFRVTFYTCGPTVYDDAHVGNFRSFLAADLLRRWIESPICEIVSREGQLTAGPRRVVHVMNITDVGHMTDDAEGGENGEDRMAVAGRRIAEAKKSGKLPADADINPGDPYQIARFYEQRFKEDGRALGLKVAVEDHAGLPVMPRATENVQGMIEVIKRLERSGAAYVRGEVGERVVYFDVSKYSAYGELSGNTLDKLREGAGGRVASENQAQKKNPADFLLWKEDASHIMKWESPWGKGYPGWHIECTVMSAANLRGTDRTPLTSEQLGTLAVGANESVIDLHSGGEDNIFPHHECEIAQSCCAFHASPTDGRFATTWFHPRFLLVEGAKMSKSKGNFYTARDLFAKEISPEAVRFELIRTHYRSNADVTLDGFKNAEARIERYRRAIAKLPIAAKHNLPCANLKTLLEEDFNEFGHALDADLNISRAIAAADSLFTGRGLAQMIEDAIAASPTASADRVEALPQAPASMADCVRDLEEGAIDRTWRSVWGAVNIMDHVLGVIFAPRRESVSNDIGVFAPGVEPNPEVLTLLEERRAARAAKDFKKSDEVRDRLAAMGYAIKDVAGGKVEVRKA